ncbi:hypothetical protein BDP27DRAFT_1439866 [Rhodocollybia butyracea]|uniref:Uncharacterized protein n=1 Tax=Rhodocollybia butyracea TaxID=206335 RepID=A0A9P5TUF8_9AGAR|nr:hypothetical protein BDP27DRAFT_1439866 [Rhodocollybia butyracea]
MEDYLYLPPDKYGDGAQINLNALNKNRLQDLCQRYNADDRGSKDSMKAALRAAIQTEPVLYERRTHLGPQSSSSISSATWAPLRRWQGEMGQGKVTAPSDPLVQATKESLEAWARSLFFAFDFSHLSLNLSLSPHNNFPAEGFNPQSTPPSHPSTVSLDSSWPPKASSNSHEHGEHFRRDSTSSDGYHHGGPGMCSLQSEASHINPSGCSEGWHYGDRGASYTEPPFTSHTLPFSDIPTTVTSHFLREEHRRDKFPEEGDSAIGIEMRGSTTPKAQRWPASRSSPSNGTRPTPIHTHTYLAPVPGPFASIEEDDSFTLSLKKGNVTFSRRDVPSFPAIHWHLNVTAYLSKVLTMWDDQDSTHWREAESSVVLKSGSIAYGIPAKYWTTVYAKLGKSQVKQWCSQWATLVTEFHENCCSSIQIFEEAYQSLTVSKTVDLIRQKETDASSKKLVRSVVSQERSIEHIMPDLLSWCTSQGLDLGLGDRESLSTQPSGALRGELVMSVFAFHLTWVGYTSPSGTEYPTGALALSISAVRIPGHPMKEFTDVSRVVEVESRMLVLPHDWNSGTSAQKYFDKALELSDDKWRLIYALSAKHASNVSDEYGRGPLHAEDDSDSIYLSE